jgi:hypothetical protein
MHLSLKGSLDRQPLTDRLGDRLLAEYGGAAAAYSLRALNGNGDSVVRVRRASDNDEEDFTAEQIELGEMVNWVNSQIVPPLDIGVLTSEGRIPVPEGGTSIGIPAAAYSLRNLSTTYTGNVVDVRRSIDDAEDSFTAAEVADGTLEAWVLAPVSSFIGNKMYFNGATSVEFSPFTMDSTENYIFDFSVIVNNVTKGGFIRDTNGNDGIKLNGVTQLQVWFSGNFAAMSLAARNIVEGVVLNLRLQNDSGTLKLIDRDDDFLMGSVAHPVGVINAYRFGNSRSNTFLDGLMFDTSFDADGSGSLTYEWDGTIDNLPAGWTVNGSPELFTGQGVDGLVSKWYDQSGNGNHATDETPASQPKIVDGGTLVTKLGQPSIDFTTGSTVLLSDSFSITETESAVFAIWQPAQDSATTVQARNRTLFGNASSQIYIGTPNSDSQMSFKRFGAVKSFTLGIANLRTPNLHAFVGTTAGADYYFNGSSIYSDTATGTNSIRNDLRIGAKQNLDIHDTEGYISELIIYDSDQSANRTAIEANIGETYGITGIPAYDNTVDGFVETWYDQSGNGNDATQSVAASQPKIVDGGSLVSGGLDFDGVDDYLLSSHILSSDDVLSLYAVGAFDDLTQRGRMVGDFFYVSFSDNGGFVLENDAFGQSGRIAGYGDDILIVHVAESFVTKGSESLFELQLASGSSSFYVNGSNVNTISATMNAEDGGSVLSIGSIPTGLNSLIGQIAEIIIYNADKTSDMANIRGNINAHYDIYA